MTEDHEGADMETDVRGSPLIGDGVLGGRCPVAGKIIHLKLSVLVHFNGTGRTV